MSRGASSPMGLRNDGRRDLVTAPPTDCAVDQDDDVPDVLPQGGRDARAPRRFWGGFQGACNMCPGGHHREAKRVAVRRGATYVPTSCIYKGGVSTSAPKTRIDGRGVGNGRGDTPNHLSRPATDVRGTSSPTASFICGGTICREEPAVPSGLARRGPDSSRIPRVTRCNRRGTPAPGSTPISAG